jgi:hypothetical protein
LQRAEEAEGKFEARVCLLVLSKQPKKCPDCAAESCLSFLLSKAHTGMLSKPIVKTVSFW